MSALALPKDSEQLGDCFSRAWTKCVRPCSGRWNPISLRGRLLQRSFTLATKAPRRTTAWGGLAVLLFFLLALPALSEERKPNLRTTVTILAPTIAADWYTSRGLEDGQREVGPVQARIGPNAGAALAFGLESAAIHVVGKRHPSVAWGMLFGFAVTHLTFAICNEAKCF